MDYWMTAHHHCNRLFPAPFVCHQKNRIVETESKTHNAGYSLIEVIVVFSIVGILAGVGAVGYRSMVETNKVASATNMISANIRQAQTYGKALRESRRVVIQFEKDDLTATDEMANRQNPPLKVWIEAKRNQALLFSGGNSYAITDEQHLAKGATVASIYLPGTVYENSPINPNEPQYSIGGGITKLYIEFDQRSQLAGIYFDSGITEADKAKTVGGQVFLHIMSWAEKVQLPNGSSQFYTELLNGSALLDIDRDHELKQERYKAETLEILALTGRVRKYEYAIGRPWASDTLDKDDA